MVKKLSEYTKKRDFTKTTEPAPKVERSRKDPIFVIQQHHASHMHYDFRIEMEGVLKSWAVPKGPSTDPAVKRLAALTEDHPLGYATFEGIIPVGYGAGTVIVWDTGPYKNINKKDGKTVSMKKSFQDGHIKIELYGEKLRGGYALVRFKNRDWLLIKVNDEHADSQRDPVSNEPQSVKSKKTISELDIQREKRKIAHKNKAPTKRSISISHPEKIYFPELQITKNDVINYYKKIADYFLVHVKNHLIVMQRFPEGIAHEGFYHKQVPEHFPEWIDRKTINLRRGRKQTLLLINDKPSLVYLANQGVLVFHSWLSSVAQVNKPDKIVFDLDPTNNSLAELRFAARKLKAIMESYDLIPYVMTSGSRGYHVAVPIIPEHSFEKVHDFAESICSSLVEKYPSRFTIEMRKSKRGGRIFLDYFRNFYGQTSVACYSLRAKEGAPIATPLEWSELSATAPQKYTIKNIFRRLSRKSDPWENFWKDARKLIFKNV